MKRLFSFFLISIILFSSPSLVFAEEDSVNTNEVQSLRQQIEEKSSELESLEKQRAELEKKLEETGAKKTSLQRELNNINWRINQLEVSMRSNEIKIEKLRLEQQSLREDIKDIEENINERKKTVGRLLVELQKKDRENWLTIFLKNDTLSESVSEIQSIMTLGDNITKNVNELRNLQTQLVKKSNEVKSKKDQVQTEQEILESRQNIVSDQKQEKQYLLAQTKSQEQTYKEKIEELEERQKEISEVMSSIEERLRLELDPSLLPKARPGLLAYPVKSDSCITQDYGRTSFAARNYRTGFHTGMDFRASTGDPIFAAGNGRVVVVENNDRGVMKWQKYQYGKYIIIEHNNNLSTLYSHLSRQVVSEGKEVKQGDIIGYAGNTGYSTAPHLHFGVYATPTLGWRESYSENRAREEGGLIEIPPAAGLVPVGATLNPADYLPSMRSCY